MADIVTSNVLQIVQSSADERLNVETFNNEAARYYDRAARLLRETTYWVYDPTAEWFGPSKFLGFAEMSFDRYIRAGTGDSEGARFDGGLTQAAISSALGTSYREDENLRARLESWGVERFGPDAFGGADRQKWRFVSLPPATEPPRPRLPLELHRRYTRADIYALFGIEYDARRTRHLNVGLSPRMSDGGYQLFITLDKETLAADYDYEDILFQDQLIWVSRRGVDQDDEDYVALREPATRVSLFVRKQDREALAYLGEVRSAGHEQFSNEGRAQQRTIWRSRCLSLTLSLRN